MDGWMNGCDRLLKALVLSLESSLSLFLRYGYRFSFLFFSLSLFLGHASLACHLFSFWGNHNLTLFCFRDVLRESLENMELLLMGNGWMMVLNSQCRNVANGWVVYVLMIEKA